MSCKEWQRDGYCISTDPDRLDRAMIVDFLSTSYWADTLPKDKIARSLDHALSFGLYAPGGAQIGYARVITDYARFAYLGDVFVLPEWRGQGLAQWLVKTIIAHEPLEGMTRWILATRDAHGLYEKCGFTAQDDPKRMMVRSGG